jgi:hypothetical protein
LWSFTIYDARDAAPKALPLCHAEVLLALRWRAAEMAMQAVTALVEAWAKQLGSM